MASRLVPQGLFCGVFYSHSSFFTHVNKWIPALCWGYTLRWGKLKYSWSLHAIETGIKDPTSANWLVCRFMPTCILDYGAMRTLSETT